MRQECITILSAADTADRTGSAKDATQLINASFQVIWSDVDLIGTVKIQASNDPKTAGAMPNQFTPTNWTDIPNASLSIAGGSAGSGIINISNMCYEYIRATLTATTPGSGTITVNMNSVGV